MATSTPRTTRRIRRLAGAIAAGVVAAAASGCGAERHREATTPARFTASRLVAIRAAHHPGFDRLIFDFTGPPPSRTRVRYVKRLVADPSGLPVPIAGRAVLQASFFPTTTHLAATTTALKRTAFALPNVMSAAFAGEFESVVSYGIGLMRRTSFHTSTLKNPSRVVIDVKTPFPTVLKKVYLEDVRRFVAGTEPYVKAVSRPVPLGAPAIGVMDRLFAGPTQAESAAGLRLERSGATGYTALSIRGTVASVRLAGTCSSRGSTFTVAGEIDPTLKQFAAVHYVKIYDAAGHTENPTGQRDSIPFCLEP